MDLAKLQLRRVLHIDVAEVSAHLAMSLERSIELEELYFVSLGIKRPMYLSGLYMRQARELLMHSTCADAKPLVSSNPQSLRHRQG